MQTNDNQGNSYLAIDIAVIYPSSENNFWWFEWVLIWEADFQKENTPLVGRIFWTKNCSNPFIKIVSLWSSTEKNIKKIN